MQRESTRYDDSAPAPPIRLVAAMLFAGMIVGAIIAPEPSGTDGATSITIAVNDVGIED